MNNQNEKESMSLFDTDISSEENMFFTKKEMNFFYKSDFKNIILHMDNGVPYLNYDVAKKIFEVVVGCNYSDEVLSYEYVPEFETLIVHVRFTLVRGDKKIIKDVLGTEKGSRSRTTNEIMNFHDLYKSAVKDAYKKFLCDYIGIGSIQFAKAKEEYAATQKNKYNKNSSKNNANNDSNETYACSDCNAPINAKVYQYSVNYHSQKRALCPNCQKKY